jgi:hypothetical protein
MYRMGHASFATTMIYVREAEVVRDGFGSVFPPLPKALLEITPGSHEGQVSEIIASPTGLAPLLNLQESGEFDPLWLGSRTLELVA